MIDGKIDLSDKIIYDPENHSIFKIINQQSRHWYTVKRITQKGTSNEYLDRRDVLQKFEVIPSEISIDEWEVVLRKGGYTETQIQFLKDCDDPEVAMSFMPRSKNRNIDETWDM